MKLMMSPQKQLKTLRKATAPRKEFKTALWSELSSAWDAEYPSMRFSWTKAFAVPVAVMVVFVTMGMGTYAYASPGVTDGTALYPVKQGMERVESQFRFSPQARARFHVRMVERRIAEGEVMLRRGQLTDQQIERIKNELGMTQEQLQEARENNQLREDVREEIIERLEAQGIRYRHLLRENRN